MKSLKDLSFIKDIASYNKCLNDKLCYDFLSCKISNICSAEAVKCLENPSCIY